MSIIEDLAPSPHINNFRKNFICNCGTNLSCEKAKEIYNKAFIDLLREICVGCAYLEGTKCNNKYGCPCGISQGNIVKVINKLKAGGENG